MLQKQINICMGKEFYNSKVYQFYMLEQQEIDKLKWIESEKVGRDIGKNKAVFLWTKYYRKNWIKNL
jgi:hypothetical protein